MIASECMVHGDPCVPRLGWPRQHGHWETKTRSPLKAAKLISHKSPKYVVPKIVGTDIKALQGVVDLLFPMEGHTAD